MNALIDINKILSIVHDHSSQVLTECFWQFLAPIFFFFSFLNLKRKEKSICMDILLTKSGTDNGG